MRTKAFFIFILLINGIDCSAQKINKERPLCSNIFKHISTKWQTASCGGRLLTYQFVEGCEIDNIIISDSVVKWLGQPDEVSHYSDTNQITFQYNLDKGDTCKHYVAYWRDKVTMTFSTKTKKLLEIRHCNVE